MGRRPRINLVGVPQHVIQRGNNREPCFYGDEDYAAYLEFLKLAAEKTLSGTGYVTPYQTFRAMQQQGKHCHTENHKRYEQDKYPVQRYPDQQLSEINSMLNLERDGVCSPFQTFRVMQQHGKHCHAENYKRYERDKNPVQQLLSGTGYVTPFQTFRVKQQQGKPCYAENHKRYERDKYHERDGVCYPVSNV